MDFRVKTSGAVRTLPPHEMINLKRGETINLLVDGADTFLGYVTRYQKYYNTKHKRQMRKPYLVFVEIKKSRVEIV